jgi:hypothetical protein
VVKANPSSAAVISGITAIYDGPRRGRPGRRYQLKGLNRLPSICLEGIVAKMDIYIIMEDLPMNDEQRNNITLESLASILGGSFLISYAVLLLWFLVFLFAPDFLYGMNTKWFAISRSEFDLINYGGMAFLKLINLVFFLSPYLSIKLVLWKRRSGRG